MGDASLKPGKVIYTCLIQACTSNRQLSRALGVFEDMWKRGIEPDGATFGALVAGCAQVSDWDKAMDLVRRAQDQKVSLTSKTYMLLGQGLKRAQEGQKMRELGVIQAQWPPDDRARVNTQVRQKMRELGVIQ